MEYVFLGWSLTPDAQAVAFKDEDEVANLTAQDGGVVELYAVWRPSQTILPARTRSGHQFEGWYDAAFDDGGGDKPPATTDDQLRDTYLKALYNAVDELSVIPDDDPLRPSLDTAATHLNAFYDVWNDDKDTETGKILTLADNYYAESSQLRNSLERLGLNKIAERLFAVNQGIATGSTTQITPRKSPSLIGNAGQSYMPTQDTVLYARWTRNTYVVVFNPNGGTVVGSQSVTVSHGDTIGEIPGGALTGYALVGWFPQLYNNDEQLTPSTQITSNRTYYAHWMLDIVTITYNGNGGTLTST